MTTTQRPDTQPGSTRRLAALRGNCMGAAVLLIIEFGLGIGINLYVTLPQHKSFLSTVLGSATLTAHAIVGIVLLGAGRSARPRCRAADRGAPAPARGSACPRCARGRPA